MQHPDEGTIHAWLDGALAPADAKRVEEHVASCESCGPAVAEARGLIAAASRILTALDDVPAGVVPAREGGAGGYNGSGDQLAALRARRAAAERKPSRWARPGVVAAAAIVFVAAGTMLVVQRGRVGVTAMNDLGDQPPSAARIANPAVSPIPRATEPAASDRIATTGAQANEQPRRKDEQARGLNRMDSSTGQQGRVAESKPAAPEARILAGTESARALAAKKAAASALNAATPGFGGAATDSLARFRRDQLSNVPLRQAVPSAERGRLGFARTAEDVARGGTTAADLRARVILFAGCYEITTPDDQAGSSPRFPDHVALDSAIAQVDGDTVWYAARTLDSADVAGVGLLWRPAAMPLDAGASAELRIRRDTVVRTVNLRLPNEAPPVAAVGATVKAARTEAATVREYVGRRVRCEGGRKP